MSTPHRTAHLGLVLAALALVTPTSARAQMRVDGLSSEPPTKLLIFTVRGEGVVTPLIAFQERARAHVEAHMHVRVLSMDETLAKGGTAFQKRLAECRGEPQCLSALVGKVNTKYLLVLTARLVGDLRLVGSRLIELSKLSVLGEAVNEVPGDKNVLDVVPERIQSSVPVELWDPFGTLTLNVGQPGAQLRINGRVVGMSPMSPLGYLLPGDYKVEALKDGYLPALATAKVTRKAETKLDLALTAQAVEGGGSSWVWWVGAGVLVAAGAATAVALVATSGSANPTFCSAVDPGACPR